MSYAAEAAPATPPALGKAGPGCSRKASTETDLQRIQRFQAQLHGAYEALVITEVRRSAAIMSHAVKAPEYRRALAAALRAEVRATTTDPLIHTARRQRSALTSRGSVIAPT
jgi:hypothetical protein